MYSNNFVAIQPSLHPTWSENPKDKFSCDEAQFFSFTNLNEFKNIIQVVSDVLFHYGNDQSKLLEQKLKNEIQVDKQKSRVQLFKVSLA